MSRSCDIWFLDSVYIRSSSAATLGSCNVLGIAHEARPRVTGGHARP